MPLAFKYIIATFKFLTRSDLPRTRILAAKFSRTLRLNIVRRWFFTDLTDRAWTWLRGDADGQLKIGVTRGGTLGDKIGLMLFLIGLRRQFPGAKILIFDWDINLKYFEMFRDQNLIDEFCLSQGDIVNDLTRMVLARGDIDILFDNRYVTKVSFGKNSRADRDVLVKAQAAFAKFELQYDDFPHHLDQLCARFPELNNFEVMSQSCLVPFDVDTFRLPLHEGDEGPRRSIGAVKYVTIHHGAGPTAWGQTNGQTKMWFVERWVEVVKALRARGFAVFQLGLAHEQVIDGADPRFLGRTTFHESAAILRDATFHLDTEGGLVHTANIVGTRAIVLFGPTPASFFGYARNANIERGGCHNCWWSIDKWQTVCAQGHAIPVCMNSITVDDVLAEVDRMIEVPI